MELKMEPFKFNFVNDVIKSILKMDYLSDEDRDTELLTPEVTIQKIKAPKPEPNRCDVLKVGDEGFPDALSEISTHFLLDDRNSNLMEEEEGAMQSISMNKCPLCEHVAPKRESLKIHIKLAHENFKPYSCALCGYASLERKMLTRHFVSVHQRFKPHKCPECRYSASLNSNLKKHVQNVHRKNKPHKCTRCAYSTSERGKLRRHVLSVHFDRRPYACESCCYSTDRERTLKSHVLAVHGQRKFVCGECQFDATDKQTLDRHIHTVHGGSQVSKCRRCHVYFGSKELLSSHVRTSHDPPAPKLFSCGDCDKIYRDKRSMKIHILSIHLKEKPFVCSYCSYRTVDIRYLRKHVATNHKTLQPSHLTRTNIFYVSNE